MKEYSDANPVLSAAGFMGSLLTDAVVFAPLTTAIASQGAATLAGSSFKSLSAAKKLGWLTAAETLEQGGQELVWSAFKKDYEFSLPIFFAGIGMGVGVRGVANNIKHNKMIKELVRNEDGFLRLGKEQSEALVRVVAKEADEKMAVNLAERLVELKSSKTNVIRTGLLEENDIVQQGVDAAKKIMQSSKKGTSEFKKARGELQTLTRRAKKLEKDTFNELRQLVDGTHPKLKTALNPEFSIRAIANELGIDFTKVDSPEKIRRYLG